MICEGCGNPVVDSTCACPSIVPDLKVQLAKLLEENSEQKKKLDAWTRYHQLLTEELNSAVGMAWIHGWRSTPEKIELGTKLRAELGLPEGRQE